MKLTKEQIEELSLQFSNWSQAAREGAIKGLQECYFRLEEIRLDCAIIDITKPGDTYESHDATDKVRVTAKLRGTFVRNAHLEGSFND